MRTNSALDVEIRHALLRTRREIDTLIRRATPRRRTAPVRTADERGAVRVRPGSFIEAVMSPAPRVVTEHGTGQLPHLASLGGPLSQWLQVGRAAVYVDVEYARHPAILRAVRDAEIAIEAALAEARVAE